MVARTGRRHSLLKLLQTHAAVGQAGQTVKVGQLPDGQFGLLLHAQVRERRHIPAELIDLGQRLHTDHTGQCPAIMVATVHLTPPQTCRLQLGPKGTHGFIGGLRCAKQACRLAKQHGLGVAQEFAKGGVSFDDARMLVCHQQANWAVERGGGHQQIILRSLVEVGKAALAPYVDHEVQHQQQQSQAQDNQPRDDSIFILVPKVNPHTSLVHIGKNAQLVHQRRHR